MNVVSELLENTVGPNRLDNPIGRTVDAVRRADGAIDTFQSKLVEAVSKAMENREKLTGIAGFLFGAKLNPTLESAIKMFEKSPNAGLLVLYAALAPVYAGAAALGGMSGLLEGHFTRRKEEYKKEFEALHFDAEGVMANLDHFPENRFVREVKIDLLPHFLFDTGESDTKRSKISRTETYNAGKFTEDPIRYTDESKEQIAYIKFRIFAIKQIYARFGHTPPTDAQIDMALKKAFENLRNGLPLDAANPEFSAIKARVMRPGRNLNEEEIIGRYFSTASRAAEDMVLSSIQTGRDITEENPEVIDQMISSKTNEMLVLLDLPNLPINLHNSRLAIEAILDALSEVDPATAIGRFLSPPMTPVNSMVRDILNLFDGKIEKLKKYFIDLPNGFIELRIRELTNFDGSDYLNLSDPVIKDRSFRAITHLLSIDSEAEFNRFVNTPPLTPEGAFIEGIFRNLFLIPVGTTIDFKTELPKIINLLEGSESLSFYQAISYLSVNFGISEDEAKVLLGSDAKAFKAKFEKGDINISTYLRLRALDGVILNIGTKTFDISQVNLSAFPTSAGPARGVPPYSKVAIDENEIYSVVSKINDQILAYERQKNDAAKESYLKSMKDFELALFAIFMQEDKFVNSRIQVNTAAVGAPPKYVVLVRNNPETYRLLNPNYKGFNNKSDIDPKVLLNKDKLKLLGNASYLESVPSAEIYSLLGLPAFADIGTVKKAAGPLTENAKVAESLFDLKSESLRPGIANLQTLLQSMYGNLFDPGIQFAVSSKIFTWIYSLTEDKIDKIESGLYHEPWVPGGYSSHIRAIVNGLRDSNVNLKDLVNYKYEINGIKISPLHIDQMLLYILNKDQYFQDFRKYSRYSRIVNAYIDNPTLLSIHDKGVYALLKDDIQSKDKDFGDKDLEKSTYGKQSSVYLLNLPEPFELNNQNSNIENYINFVSAKVSKLEKGFGRTPANMYGSTMVGPMIHFPAIISANPAQVARDVEVLVEENSPEVSSNILYLYEIYPTRGAPRNWANFSVYIRNLSHNDEILNLLSNDTDSVTYNNEYLNQLRSTFNRLNTLHLGSPLFRAAVDNPAVSAFEFYSLLVGTFQIRGRDSVLNVPSFREILQDFRHRALSITTPHDVTAWLQDIYNDRMSPGVQLSHPTLSPIAIIKSSVAAFYTDGKISFDSIDAALKQRRGRLELERLSRNPAPDPDINQYVNLLRSIVGVIGDLTFKEDNIAKWN